jgi:cell wall-associated NlpC family hydrolase
VLRSSTIVAAASVALPLAAAAAQQSDLQVSPFVTFMPTGGASPLAGLALTMAGNGGLALRASGHLSLENTNNTNASLGAAPTMRPWGADADAVIFLGGRYLGGYVRTASPYAFVGIGAAGRDSIGRSVITNNWSYGGGLTVPLGANIDLFGESRWRMSRYVLPTARFAPSPTNEFRVGVSFHVGSLGSRSRSAPSRPTSRRSELPATTYPASTNTTAAAARLIDIADNYLGVPYVYGGTTTSGFDCSGFTQYVFAKNGVRLPRTSREQAQVGMALSPEWRAVAPGDLVMFAEQGERISHVAIYAGHNRIIHSSSSGGGVRFDDLSTQRGAWFVDHMVAARRIEFSSRSLILDLAKNFSDINVQLDGPDHAPRPGKFE